MHQIMADLLENSNSLFEINLSRRGAGAGLRPVVARRASWPAMTAWTISGDRVDGVGLTILQCCLLQAKCIYSRPSTQTPRGQDSIVVTVQRPLRAAIVGTGFIGTVHARAVRACGHSVSAVVNVNRPAAEAAARTFGAEHALTSLESALALPEIDVVHICTPNVFHVSQVTLALEHGKHVVCEKPLATSVADAARLLELAEQTARVAAVPFVYRFYPTVREARERIRSGSAGALRVLHGSYLQDWLSSADDTNWRVDSATGGASRAFADIGVHWCDLMEFVTGHRITRVVARLFTLPDRPSQTEDVATVMFETDRGAVGSTVISQVSLGRKNRLWFSFDGTDSAFSFNQELPDSLWIGGRDLTQTVARGSAATSQAARMYDVLPAGHPQGFADCFEAFVADVYRAAGGATTPDGLPSFADGLRAAVLTAAVIEAARTDSWVTIPG